MMKLIDKRMRTCKCTRTFHITVKNNGLKVVRIDLSRVFFYKNITESLESETGLICLDPLTF